VQVQISTRHGQISEESREFIQEKVEKMLHLFNRITRIEVTVDMKEDERIVELLVNAEHKHDFVAQDRNKEMLIALDGAVSKLEGQLRRYKGKIQDHRRDPSTGEVAGAPTLEETTEE
jgi:putative sigma-54 modulation protein